MSKAADTPTWPTKRRKERARRRSHRADDRKPQGERIARELMAERGGIIPRQAVTDERHDPVVITTLWDGIGQAYVKVRSGDQRVVVHWGPKFWDCHQCGRQSEPTCEHTRLIPQSAALKHARRIRNITTNQ